MPRNMKPPIFRPAFAEAPADRLARLHRTTDAQRPTTITAPPPRQRQAQRASTFRPSPATTTPAATTSKRRAAISLRKRQGILAGRPAPFGLRLGPWIIPQGGRARAGRERPNRTLEHHFA